MIAAKDLTASNVTDLSDTDLIRAYEDGCNMSSLMYDAGMDSADVDSAVDLLVAEMFVRGLA